MAPTPSPSPSAPVPGIFEEMSDEDLKAILGLGDLERQISVAERLANQPQLEGRYVSGGRIYVADAPLAHGLRAYTQRKGRKRVRSLAEEESDIKQSLADLLRGKKRTVKKEPQEYNVGGRPDAQ